MSVHILPFVPSIAEYRFGVTIEETHYIIDTHWNSTEQLWSFDLLLLDETPILTGISIVLGAFLGRTGYAPPFTTGVFVAFDTSNSGKEAGFDDLGTRVVVQYVPVLDLLAKKAEYAERKQLAEE